MALNLPPPPPVPPTPPISRSRGHATRTTQLAVTQLREYASAVAGQIHLMRREMVLRDQNDAMMRYSLDVVLRRAEAAERALHSARQSLALATQRAEAAEGALAVAVTRAPLSGLEMLTAALEAQSAHGRQSTRGMISKRAVASV